MKAKYQHDCDLCELVATIDGPDGRIDWYIHKRDTYSGDDILGRYGDEGAQYYSYNPHTVHMSPWATAVYDAFSKSRSSDRP